MDPLNFLDPEPVRHKRRNLYYAEALIAHNEAANLIAVAATLVAKRRKQLKMSQSELARKAGLSRLTVVALERGDGNARLATLQAVAVALNLDLTLMSSPTHPDD